MYRYTNFGKTLNYLRTLVNVLTVNFIFTFRSAITSPSSRKSPVRINELTLFRAAYLNCGLLPVVFVRFTKPRHFRILIYGTHRLNCCANCFMESLRCIILERVKTAWYWRFSNWKRDNDYHVFLIYHENLQYHAVQILCIFLKHRLWRGWNWYLKCGSVDLLLLFRKCKLIA